MRIWAIALFLLLAGCARREADTTAAIQEAVLRYQFEHNAAVGQTSPQVHFLAFGDPHGKDAIDPPKEFMSRFTETKSRIARFSEAGRTERGWVIDPKTKEAGIIFFVFDVRMTGPNSAEAKGGYQQDKLSASGNTYQLEFGWRGWHVVTERLDWISRKTPNKSPDRTPLGGVGQL